MQARGGATVAIWTVKWVTALIVADSTFTHVVKVPRFEPVAELVSASAICSGKGYQSKHA